MKPDIALLAILAARIVSAIKIPDNVQKFYDRAKSGRCEGTDKLKGGFFDQDGDGVKGQWSYCQKFVEKKAIFIHGPNTFANMDIDCDGNQSTLQDRRCSCPDGQKCDTQGETAFKKRVQKVSGGRIKDLNPNIHPYVVFGNYGGYSPTFDPEAFGIRPLSVMAVVCGKKLIYGVWGDQNGDDDEHPLVGEASLSLATACFGTDVSGESGHDETDVLYVAFTGDDAVPTSANWAAKSFEEFEESITEIGNELITRLPSSP
ncbi:MAG: hypothetical protein Q9167_002269 [Letrouitia subvulpina]